MLVICEECDKRYNIDEARIKGQRVKFSCTACGHIIAVEKPDPADSQLEDNSTPSHEPPPEFPSDQQQAQPSAPTQPVPMSNTKTSRNMGVPIGVYILLTLVSGFLMVCASFGYLYLKYIPEIMNTQIELRTSSIAQSFAGGIKKPLLLRNYLQVNKEAKRTSKLPGVAYAAVLNSKGIIIAGFFSDLDRFDKQFATRVKEKGFPLDILSPTKLQGKEVHGHGKFTIGGQTLYDEVVMIPDVGGEVHIGIYVSEIDSAIRDVLVSPLTLSILGAILFMGFIVFIFLTRTITKPMQDLTAIAYRISLGEMDLHITPSGPREMRILGTAFERMRRSIKSAVERLSV